MRYNDGGYGGGHLVLISAWRNSIEEVVRFALL